MDGRGRLHRPGLRAPTCRRGRLGLPSGEFRRGGALVQPDQVVGVPVDQAVLAANRTDVLGLLRPAVRAAALALVAAFAAGADAVDVVRPEGVVSAPWAFALRGPPRCRMLVIVFAVPRQPASEPCALVRPAGRRRASGRPPPSRFPRWLAAGCSTWWVAAAAPRPRRARRTDPAPAESCRPATACSSSSPPRSGLPWRRSVRCSSDRSRCIRRGRTCGQHVRRTSGLDSPSRNRAATPGSVLDPTFVGSSYRGEHSHASQRFVHRISAPSSRRRAGSKVVTAVRSPERPPLHPTVVVAAGRQGVPMVSPVLDVVPDGVGAARSSAPACVAAICIVFLPSTPRVPARSAWPAGSPRLRTPYRGASSSTQREP